MAHNKKGIEMSINFLVMLIITIVVFSFGISFIYRLSSDAMELSRLTNEDLDERIGQLSCSSSEKVCVISDRKTIERGEFDVFGLNIVNINDGPSDFIIKASHPTPTGYKKDDTEIYASLDILPTQRSERIERNEEKKVAIGVEIPDNVDSGTYIINVYVCDANPCDSANPNNHYDPVKKLYVVVP